jgi:beta-lactamase superfamily II metal-dependent hydrolase
LDLGLLIRSLKANHGDCFLFQSSDEDITFIVDCGLKVTYKQQILKYTNKADFIILTHIDEDHILGAIPLLQDLPLEFSLKKMYFNSPNKIPYLASHGKISVRQAQTVEDLLKKNRVNVDSLIQGEVIELSKNLKLEIISPTTAHLETLHSKKLDFFNSNKDTKTEISNNHKKLSFSQMVNQKDEYLNINSDIVNACSIAFLLTYKSKKFLYLADSHPEVIADYLELKGYSNTNKLKVDIVKLSHHGSSKSISNRLLSMISCSKYWISTNGGKARSKHPSPVTLAKIAVFSSRYNSESITFYFNYDIEQIEARNGILLSEEDKRNNNIIFKEINEVRWL